MTVSNSTFTSLVQRYSHKDGKIYFDDYIHCIARLRTMFGELRISLFFHYIIAQWKWSWFNDALTKVDWKFCWRVVLTITNVVNFWQKATSQRGGGQIFHGEDNVMWDWPLGSILQSTAAVVLWCRYWFFVVYDAVVTDSAFQCARQPPIIASSPLGSGPLSNTWFLCSIWVSLPKQHLDCH